MISWNNQTRKWLYSYCMKYSRLLSGSIVPDDVVDEDSTLLFDANTTPPDFDYLVCYAALHGQMAYRSPHTGSCYINALVDNIRQHHNEWVHNMRSYVIRQSVRSTVRPGSISKDSGGIFTGETCRLGDSRWYTADVKSLAKKLHINLCIFYAGLLIIYGS